VFGVASIAEKLPRGEEGYPYDVGEPLPDELPGDIEIRRIRLERWRIVYAVSDAEQWVRVLGIYRRPPYNYGDLAALTQRLSS